MFCQLSCPRVCVCVKKKTMSQYPWNISEISHNCKIYHSVICHVRVCVWKRMPWASIRVTSLKLLTIVRHIILSSVMSVCVCVCVKRMPWASIRVTFLKLFTIVRHILSSVMSVCVQKNAYQCNISGTSHKCQLYYSVTCHVRVTIIVPPEMPPIWGIVW